MAPSAFASAFVFFGPRAFPFNEAQIRFCEASQVFRIRTDRFVAALGSLARKDRQLLWRQVAGSSSSPGSPGSGVQSCADVAAVFLSQGHGLGALGCGPRALTGGCCGKENSVATKRSSAAGRQAITCCMSPSAPFDIASGDTGIAGLAEYSDPGNSNDRRQHAARKCARGEALQELSSTTDQEQNAAIDRRIGLGRRSPKKGHLLAPRCPDILSSAVHSAR
jgi:hypothetical protein